VWAETAQIDGVSTQVYLCWVLPECGMGWVMQEADSQDALWGPGTVIGDRYRLIDRVGAGAMGEVWRAEHVSLGTHVAVKLVDARRGGEPREILARFRREARATAKLKSPFVVQIHDHGGTEQFAYIAMDFTTTSMERQRRFSFAKAPHGRSAHPS